MTNSERLCRFIVIIPIAGLLLWMAPVASAGLQNGAATAPDSDPTTYASIVGINSYEVAPIEGGVLDAETVYKRMTDADLGLVRPEDTILLLEEEADGAMIDDALDDLFRRADENDVVIFFWAGSAEYEVFADDLFLFPFDVTFREDGALNSGEFSLRRRVLARAAAFSGRFVFIGDSCGGFSEDSLKVENVTLLTSAQPDEYAIEGFRGHGLFTFHFLNALDAPRTDADRDGRISLDEVYNSLYQRVVDDSRSRQHPALVGADPRTIELARAVPAPTGGGKLAEVAAAEVSFDVMRPRVGARIAALLPPSPADVAGAPRADVSPADIEGEHRQALVIGNGTYSNGISRLPNPSHDAEDMAGILTEAGFDVTLAVDLDRAGMERAIVEFGRALRDGGVGLFFYAGHAVQLNGKNYLIPIGAGIEDEDYVPLETVDVDDVLWRMGGADNRLNIVILDACRDNPFPRSFRGISRGLAPLVAPHGTFIAYATAPGDVAFDGLGGRNSPFTAALLEILDEPGLKIEEVFKRVTAKVRERTRGDQNPWVHSSITGDFHFRPPASERGAPEVAGHPAALADRPDYLAWMAIQGSREAIDFETFIGAFPHSALRPFAERRLRSLGTDR